MNLLKAGIVVAVTFLGVLTIWWAYLGQPTSKDLLQGSQTIEGNKSTFPVDPRLSDDLQFRNIRPEVRYVGDASCSGCHTDICDTYHIHPMGHSASYMQGTESLENYQTSTSNPKKISNYRLSVSQSQGETRHSLSADDSEGNTLPPYQVPITLAIGSGAHGRSYVSLEKGTAWQSPISWFAAGEQWDLSPGFELGTGKRRPINANCLFCHVNQFDAITNSINQYHEPMLPVQPAIGCERCHGPGELHVSERTASQSLSPLEISGMDSSIVNPAHLTHGLQMAVCEQCHLQGKDRIIRLGRREDEYRPGLPFGDFVTVFVQHESLPFENKQVSQFEQLQQSHCKLANGNSLLCTTCHNPHSKPQAEAAISFYRDACVSCHVSRGCTTSMADRSALSDNCLECHMPKAGSANVAHTSITDHRILRVASQPTSMRTLSSGVSPLVAYHGDKSLPKMELQRSLGVALSNLTLKFPAGSSMNLLMGQYARERLKQSLRVWNDDVDAWRAMSRARSACNEPRESFLAALRAYELGPDDEMSLKGLSEAADLAGELECVEKTTSKLIKLNPDSAEYLVNRAANYSTRRLWAKAEDDCQAALVIHPLHPMAHLILGACLHHRGETLAGHKEAETAFRLATSKPQETSFRNWFREAVL